VVVVVVGDPDWILIPTYAWLLRADAFPDLIHHS
jgi:hypothetical protein